MHAFPPFFNRFWIPCANKYYVTLASDINYESVRITCKCVFVKRLKLSLYRSGQVLSGSGVWGSQNFKTICTWRWYNIVNPSHRPPLPPENISFSHFFWKLSRPQGHSAGGRNKSTKNPNDPIWNRKRDLSACSLNELHHSVPLDLWEANWYTLYLWILQHTCLMKSAQMAVVYVKYSRSYISLP